jgi:hypothetical protein
MEVCRRPREVALNLCKKELSLDSPLQTALPFSPDGAGNMRRESIMKIVRELTLAAALTLFPVVANATTIDFDDLAGGVVVGAT